MDGVNEAGLQCIAEFVGSLVEEVDGISSANEDRARRVFREIFSSGFQTTLKLSTDYDPNSKVPLSFSRALERNISKFPTQEQHLCRTVYGIEAPDAKANAFVETNASDSAIISRDVGWIRRLLQRNALQAEDAIKIRNKLLDPLFSEGFSQIPSDFRTTFLRELRTNLVKFAPDDQRAICQHVEGLDLEIIKLLDILGSELSKWLEFAKKQNWPPHAMPRLISLLKSILAVPFGVAFKNMPTTSAAIATKESFLLVMAICLTHASRRFENAEVVHLIEELRHQFFYVQSHGDLMESWLKNRIKVVNEEFLLSATKMTANAKNHAALLARLQLVLTPGKWTSLEEWAVEQELVTLFGSGTTPQHAVIPQTLAKALSLLGVPHNVHIFDTIARIPTTRDEKRQEPRGPDERFKRCLEAYPTQLPFILSPYGAHKFGNLDITLQELPDGGLQVAFGDEHGRWRELDADHFIQEYGPRQAPTASYEAVHGRPPPLNYLSQAYTLHQSQPFITTTHHQPTSPAPPWHQYYNGTAPNAPIPQYHTPSLPVHTAQPVEHHHHGAPPAHHITSPVGHFPATTQPPVVRPSFDAFNASMRPEMAPPPHMLPHAEASATTPPTAMISARPKGTAPPPRGLAPPPPLLQPPRPPPQLPPQLPLRPPLQPSQRPPPLPPQQSTQEPLQQSPMAKFGIDDDEI
eukprot:GEMP01028694.1.p1 GENE.GEMP01028694.1~~GEMP01028694.1.p1  ORF type:complete len:691 (+),score=151.96 GEMP01028694.1:175-2247(+)